MALVMLPCDLPWWSTVQRHLGNLRHAKSTADVIEGMQRLHDLCNVGLDPDDPEKPDPSIFSGLRSFLDRDMDQTARQHFLSVTLPSMVHCALQLKQWRPPSGLHFSLQQQPDRVQLSRQFLAALVAHAFFSTFPKRTPKTHPTLQDFNFTHFFRHLHRNSQKAKLWSIFYYYDQIAESEPEGGITLSRQVLSSRQWLTLEDWVESEGPLCPLVCRHEGRLEGAEPWALRACFSSPLIGGRVLSGGCSQECIQFSTHPELLGLLLWVEALEDNEAFRVNGLQPEGSSRITDPKGRAIIEPTKSEGGRGRLRLCLADAEDYGTYPMRQWEEDNLLRELNKAFLAFRPTATSSTPPNRTNVSGEDAPRRLSPIGESFGSTPPEAEESGRDDVDQTFIEEGNVKSSKSQRRPPPSSLLRAPSPDSRRRFITLGSSGEQLPVRTQPLRVGGVGSGDRSSSRTLPPSFEQVSHSAPRLRSQYGSCHSGDSAASSSDEAFHSARTSLEDEGPEQKSPGENKGNSNKDNETQSAEPSEELDEEEYNYALRHSSFAERLREALNRSGASVSSSSAAVSSPQSRHRPPRLSSSNYSSSSSQGFTTSSTSSSSYAVGISVAGSEVDDCNVWLRRGGSRGFVLEDEGELGECDEWVGDGLELEQEWVKAFRARRRMGSQLLARREEGAGDSSRYSFSTDYGSELEEIYEQFGHWLESPEGPVKNVGGESNRARGEAVVRFASGLLKRALSDSFAGVALDGGGCGMMRSGGREGCGEERECADGAGNGTGDGGSSGGCKGSGFIQPIPPVARSLSLSDRLGGGNRRQRMAEHLVSLLGAHADWSAGENGCDGEGPLPIATGNWGCGTSSSYVHPSSSSPRLGTKSGLAGGEQAGGGGGGGGCGDPQLKAVLQWLAASRAQAPCLIYYTCSHPRMLKLDTVCRVILDRQWTVGELTSAVLRFAQSRLEAPACDRSQAYGQDSGTEGRLENNLFEDLIGTDKPVVLIETEL